MKESFEKLYQLMKINQKFSPRVQQTSLKKHAEKLKGEIEEMISEINAENFKYFQEKLGDVFWDLLQLIVLSEKKGLFEIKDFFQQIYHKINRKKTYLLCGRKITLEEENKVWGEVKKTENKEKMNNNDNSINQEIEIKILDIQPDEVRKKLVELGATKVFEGNLKIVTFDSPKKDLKKEGKLLRVRKIGNKTELCFKGKNKPSKFNVREEIEVLTDNFENTLTILEKVGFKRKFEGNKNRESYQLGKIKFEIDTYTGIPTFLEIEASSEKEVAKFVKKLGYTMKQTSTLTGKKLFKHYQNGQN